MSPSPPRRLRRGQRRPVQLRRRARHRHPEVPVGRDLRQQLQPLQGPGPRRPLPQAGARRSTPRSASDFLRAFEKRLLDEEVHYFYTLQWHRIVPHNAKVRGWTITPCTSSTSSSTRCGSRSSPEATARRGRGRTAAALGHEIGQRVQTRTAAAGAPHAAVRVPRPGRHPALISARGWCRPVCPRTGRRTPCRRLSGGRLEVVGERRPRIEPRTAARRTTMAPPPAWTARRRSRISAPRAERQRDRTLWGG